jgi:hypothetical protein
MGNELAPNTDGRQTKKDGLSFARIPVLVVMAAFISFVLLQVWKWTAQFSWSSDPWLMAIPLVIIAAGFLSLLGLAIMGFARCKRRE